MPSRKTRLCCRLYITAILLRNHSHHSVLSIFPHLWLKCLLISDEKFIHKRLTGLNRKSPHREKAIFERYDTVPVVKCFAASGDCKNLIRPHYRSIHNKAYILGWS